MNFPEAIELHRIVADFWSQNCSGQLKIGFFDIQVRELGYILCVKLPRERGEFESFIKGLLGKRRLEVDRFKGFYIIHSAGPWNPLED